jgi:hypothetical protein
MRPMQVAWPQHSLRSSDGRSNVGMREPNHS